MGQEKMYLLCKDKIPDRSGLILRNIAGIHVQSVNNKIRKQCEFIGTDFQCFNVAIFKAPLN